MHVRSPAPSHRAPRSCEITLVLFEDDWFMDHDIRPGNVHLLAY